MNNEKIPMRETLYLAVGEVIVGVLIAAVYLIIGKFDYTVVTGACLGAIVAVGNFLYLSVSMNRALDRATAGVDMQAISEAYKKRDEADKRMASGDAPPEDEDDSYNDKIIRFQQENQARFTAAMKISYFIRTFSMLAVFIIAFLTNVFNVIATLIPLLMFRPLLYLSQLVGRRNK